MTRMFIQMQSCEYVHFNCSGKELLRQEIKEIHVLFKRYFFHVFLSLNITENERELLKMSTHYMKNNNLKFRDIFREQ